MVVEILFFPLKREKKIVEKKSIDTLYIALARIVSTLYVVVKKR